MLIGYPVDYRNVEDISDAIKPFGRLLFWQRDNVLERIIITELVDVPHYIIISESDDHEGTSLTAQCEIIQQNMLGNLLQDEDLPPGPGGPGNDFVPPGIGIPQNHNDEQSPVFPPPQALEFPDLNAPPEQLNNIDMIQENDPMVGNNIQVDAEMADLVPEVPNVQDQVANQVEINMPPSDSLFQGCSASSSSIGNIPEGNAVEEDAQDVNAVQIQDVVLALPAMPQPDPVQALNQQGQNQNHI